jgi:peptide deformylase
VFNPAGVCGEGEELVLVNPRIVTTSKGRQLGEEGCLSFARLGTSDLIRADVEVRLHSSCLTAATSPGTFSHS